MFDRGAFFLTESGCDLCSSVLYVREKLQYPNDEGVELRQSVKKTRNLTLGLIRYLGGNSNDKT